MKTVKVRIPVAVNANEQWCVTYGSLDTSDKDFLRRIFDEAKEFGVSTPSIVWITAEVPIPEPVEVEGSVEQ